MSKVGKFFEDTQTKLIQLFAQKAQLETQLLAIEDQIKNIEAVANGVRFGIQLKEEDGNDDNADEQSPEGSAAV